MNTHNNKRKQASIKKFKEAFMVLLEKKELKDIKVNDICELSGLNRTTFYASFNDLYDLIESIKVDYEDIIINRVKYSGDEFYFLNLFNDVYKNQLEYKTYFKLFSDKRHQSNLLNALLKDKWSENKEMEYRIVFFRAGLAAFLNKWLQEGCKESPEEIHSYLVKEYGQRDDIK